MDYESALRWLNSLDPDYPRPPVVDVLSAPENRHLLEYVTEDPFGAHVFPGNVPGYSPDDFLRDLDQQLANSPPIHLWAYIPTCGYRCRFCQYPVVIVKGDVGQKAERWVDLNIAEAKLWLARVPHLAEVPIGEFNVFGGTPSLLPPPAIARLFAFYREHFRFTPATAIRFEGDPPSLSRELLDFLASQGCTKVSCGVQSFDDPVLQQSGREHSAEQCVTFVQNAQRAGFPWISIDLMYGLLDQTVASVARDVAQAVDSGATAVVCTKLHLKSYSDTRTGVAGDKPAAWQLPTYRRRLALEGHRWPTLGEQYQMREILAHGLEQRDYVEHPTMYFARRGLGPEVWKSIMVDQDKQEAEVAIGLGGSSSCRASEAMTEVNVARYTEAIESGRVPLASATKFDDRAKEARAIKMALSTLQPLSDSLHRQRFSGRSLFDEPWESIFCSLDRRNLAVVDNSEIRLTPEGKVLVEAIINTEFDTPS